MEKFTVRDGTEIAIDSIGVGRPVVFLHGWAGETEYYWGEIMPIIAKAGYRAIGIDQRGSGKTAKSRTKPVTQKLWVDDLYDIMEAMDLKDVTLIGSSMGATAIMQFVLKYGCIDRIRAAIFCDQTPCVTKQDGWRFAMLKGTYKLEDGLAAYEVMKNDFFAYYRGFVSAMEPQTREMGEEEFNEYVRKMMTHIRPDECADLFYDSQFADSRAAIPIIKFPVGYFYADPGSLYDVEVKDYYTETIPSKVTTVPFPSTNHLFFIDMPEQFAKEVIKFLQDN